MPGWNWHIHLANDVANKMEIGNINEFLFGSVMPDTPWLSYEQAVLSLLRSQLHMYRNEPGYLFAEADCMRWVKYNKDCVRKWDLWKGALTHVVLDELLNQSWNLCLDRVTYDTYHVCTHGETIRMLVPCIRKEAAQACENYERLVASNVLEYFTPNPTMFDFKTKQMLYDMFGVNNRDILTMCDSIISRVTKDEQDPRDNKVLSVEQYNEIHNVAVQQSLRLIKICMMEDCV